MRREDNTDTGSGKGSLGSGLLRFAAGAFAAMAAGALTWGYAVEPDRLELRRTRLHLPAWPKAANGYRVGMLSDFHVHNNRDAKRAQRSVEMLLGAEPDVVLLGGDFISLHPRRNAPLVADALGRAADCPDGAFAVFGNHDWWSKGATLLTNALTQAGVRVLFNENVPLRNGAWIVGLDSALLGKADAQAALAEVPASAPKLLLVHEPDYADNAPPGFTLQLSGHSHGGQVQAPGHGPILLPAMGRHYPDGLGEGPRHPLYTTRGVGCTGLPIRFFCPPEVTLIELYGEG